MHRTPPPDGLGAFIEYRRLPESVDLFTDTPEERLIKLGFRTLELLEQWPAGLVP